MKAPTFICCGINDVISKAPNNYWIHLLQLVRYGKYKLMEKAVCS